MLEAGQIMSGNMTSESVHPSIWVLAVCTSATWLSGLWAPISTTFAAVASCWFVFGAYVAYRLFRKGHKWLLAMPVLFLVAIAIGVSMPLETFNQLLHPVNEFLEEKGSPIAAGKIGHVICFSVLTFFLLLHRKHWELSLVELFIILALLGIATEGIQLFIAGRTPKVVDFGLDAFGACIGTVVYLLIRIRKGSKTSP